MNVQLKRQLQLDSQEIETNHKPNNSEQELISEDNSNNKVIFKMSNKLLIFMSLTSGVIGVAFATISPIIGAFEDVIPWENGRLVFSMDTVSDVFSDYYYIDCTYILLCYRYSNCFSVIITIQSHNVIMS